MTIVIIRTHAQRLGLGPADDAQLARGYIASAMRMISSSLLPETGSFRSSQMFWRVSFLSCWSSFPTSARGCCARGVLDGPPYANASGARRFFLSAAALRGGSTSCT